MVLLAVVSLSQQWLNLINRLPEGIPAAMACWVLEGGIKIFLEAFPAEVFLPHNLGIDFLEDYLYSYDSLAGVTSALLWVLFPAAVYKLCCLWHALSVSFVSEMV